MIKTSARRFALALALGVSTVAAVGVAQAQSTNVTGTDPVPIGCGCVMGQSAVKAPSTVSTSGTVAQSLLLFLGLA